MTTQDSTYEPSTSAEGQSYEGDHDPSGRHVGETTSDSEVLDDGPTLLPVDAESDATGSDVADGDTGAPATGTTVTDADPYTDATPVRDDEIGATAATSSADLDPADTAPDTALDTGTDTDTDTGTGTGTIPEAPDAVAGPAVVTSSPSSVTSTPSSTGADDEWHELQSHFVDDPADAVRQAGQLVEQALADLRAHLESGDTESLRTTFRRYRELHASLI